MSESEEREREREVRARCPQLTKSNYDLRTGWHGLAGGRISSLAILSGLHDGRLAGLFDSLLASVACWADLSSWVGLNALSLELKGMRNKGRFS
jgi:hypothetical protein